MDKKIIEDTFNSIFNKHYVLAVKCSQGFRLNKSVVAAFDRFHDETCNPDNPRKTEKAIVTDKDGNILYSKNGGQHSVNIDSREIENLHKEYSELHMTHNHPRVMVQESLSSADVRMLFEQSLDGEYTYKSISCESPNGTRMTLVRGDGFKSENLTSANILGADLQEFSNQYESEFYNSVRRLQQEHPYENRSGESMVDAGKRYYEYVDYLQNLALKEIGVCEKHPRFKELQEKFRDIDCKLTYTYPRDYNIGYLVVV